MNEGQLIDLSSGEADPGEGQKDLPVEVPARPKDWKILTVEDLTTKLMGGGTPSRSVPEYWGGDLPWASVKDLDGPVLGSTEEHITEEGLADSTANRVPAGSVVLSTRMTVGEAFLNECDLAINQDLKALIPERSRVNSLFLTYALRNQDPYLKSLGRGTTVSGITTSDVRHTHIATPPLEEQRKIAGVLYTVDKCVTINAELLTQVERVKKGIAERIFEKGVSDHSSYSSGHHKNRLKRYPESWSIVSAGELMNISRGAHPRPKSDTSLWGGGIPMIKIGDRDRGDGRVIRHTADCVTEAGAKASKYVSEGILLVSNAGTCGFARITGMNACVHDHWLILQGYEDIVSKRYLYHYINFNRPFLSALASGSTVDDLNTDDFRLFDVAIPSQEEQALIADILDAWHDYAFVLRRMIESYRRVKRGLMQDLLSGEVRTDDVELEVPEEVAAYG